MRIRLHHIIIVYSCLCLSGVSFGQSEYYDDHWNLEFVIEWDGEQWNTSLNNTFNTGREGDRGIEIRRNDSESPKLMSLHDYHEHEIPWSSVKGITIIVVNEKPNCPDKKFLLSSFTELNDCPIDSIKSLSIDYSRYGCQLNADVGKLTWLNGRQASKSLERLMLTGFQAPQFDLLSLKGHPITILTLSHQVMDEILEFPTIEQLAMPGIRNAFSHYVASLPKLKVIRDSDIGQYFNRFHHEHAERYFFLRTSDAAHRPIVYSPNAAARMYFMHPLAHLVEHAKEMLPDKWPKKGVFYVNEDELPARTHGKNRGDTLVHGLVKRGKMKGVYTFRLEEQYDFNDLEAFHLKVDDKPPLIPANGIFDLKYSNGRTALSGLLNEEKKHGEWLFYKESGELACRRYFDSDTLKQTIVYFHMNGTPLESRAYYISENASIQAFDNNGKVQFLYIDRWLNEKDPMVINENSISLIREDGSYTIYNRNHPEFETIFRKQVIDKVYPEYIGKDVPFTY